MESFLDKYGLWAGLGISLAVNLITILRALAPEMWKSLMSSQEARQARRRDWDEFYQEVQQHLINIGRQDQVTRDVNLSRIQEKLLDLYEKDQVFIQQTVDQRLERMEAEVVSIRHGLGKLLDMWSVVYTLLERDGRSRRALGLEKPDREQSGRVG